MKSEAGDLLDALKGKVDRLVWQRNELRGALEDILDPQRETDLRPADVRRIAQAAIERVFGTGVAS